MADAENQDGVAILVGVKTEAKRAVRVNITLPEDVLKAIDAFAEAQGLTRSGFLVRPAKHEIGHAHDDYDDNYAEKRLGALADDGEDGRGLAILRSDHHRRERGLLG